LIEYRNRSQTLTRLIQNYVHEEGIFVDLKTMDWNWNMLWHIFIKGRRGRRRRKMSFFDDTSV